MVAAIAIMVGVLGVIYVTTSTSDTTNDGSAQELQNQVESITIELLDVSILQVSA